MTRHLTTNRIFVILAVAFLAACAAPRQDPINHSAVATRPEAAATATPADSRAVPRSAANTQQQPASSRVPVSAPLAAKLTANPFDPRDSDLEPGLQVDGRCAQAGTRAALAYAGGPCDSSGLPDGMAAAKAWSGNLLIEGVFDAGKFVPGVKYRTLLRFRGGETPIVINCTEMRPTQYGFGQSRSSDGPEFTSTGNTVCKETRAGRKGIYLIRKLEPMSDGAIKIGAIWN